MGPSGAGFDLRKASLGSVISHGTLPSGSKVSVFKDSASKEGSGRESGSGGSKFDDADDKGRLVRHAAGSVGGSDHQQHDEESKDSTSINLEKDAKGGVGECYATQAVLKMNQKQQEPISAEVLQTLINQQIQLENYQSHVQVLQADLTRKTSETKMFQLRLAALQAEYEKILSDDEFLEQVLLKWMDGKASLNVRGIHVSFGKSKADAAT